MDIGDRVMVKESADLLQWVKDKVTGKVFTIVYADEMHFDWVVECPELERLYAFHESDLVAIL